MAPGSTLVARLRRALSRLPVVSRVLIGNSAVIVVGAVGGTLLTRHLAEEREFALIFLFSALGILLSLGVNYWIIRSALDPLRRLQTMVDRIQAGARGIDLESLRLADPDTRRLARAIQSMLARLEEHRLQLRALSERALNAQEDERKRIARNLHDDTGQALSTLIISLDRAERDLPDGAASVRQRLAEMRLLATRTLEDLRKLVYGLRPTILDDLGLVPAIRWYARSNLEEAGIEARYELPEGSTRFAPQVETALFRIAQEAIHNILRHADAQHVSLTLRHHADDVRLVIQDDGRGFDRARTSEQAVPLRRLGLLGIQERVDLVGGRMEVDSAPGQGTRLTVHVPLANLEQTWHEQ